MAEISYGNDEIYERRMMARRRLYRKIGMGLFVILIAFIGFIAIMAPHARDQQIKGISNVVLNSLLDAVASHDQQSYAERFFQPISEWETKMIDEFDRDRGDSISYKVYDPEISVFPNGLAQLSLRVVWITRINGAVVERQVYYYLMRYGDMVRISLEPIDIGSNDRQYKEIKETINKLSDGK